MTKTPELALVTGASSGIGAACARQLADRGYEVIAAARRVDRLEELAAGHPGITSWELDVTDQGSVDRLVAHLAGRAVAVLVANAGAAFEAEQIENADLAGWQAGYELNVIGLVRTVKSFLPNVELSGHGLIVLMGSTAGYIPYENAGSYTATKHGVAAIAGTLRLELSGRPIRVTEMIPGMVRTDEFSVKRFGGDQARADKVYEGVKEPLTADDVATAITWVASLPAHVNIDRMVIRPVAQAAQHKVHRVLGE
jgi:NADP-dependent 3-hydroxy acid dehydrogenase YdfG